MDTYEVEFLVINALNGNVRADYESKLWFRRFREAKFLLHNQKKKASQGINYFYHSHKNNQFCNIILFQFVVSTTLDRLKTDV